jgi:hypothetical protein
VSFLLYLSFLKWSIQIFDVGLQNKVKKVTSQAQSAGLSNKININKSQRPNAEDLMWLVGYIEGEGDFSVNKNGKYVKFELGVEVAIRDIQLLYKIKSLLGIGSITFRTNRKMAIFKISSKTQLKEIILPIFDKYPMLTSKYFDYIYFRSNLLKNILYFADLSNYERPLKTPFLNINDLLMVFYFDCWLVGFIEAEGCFCTYSS